MTQFRTVDAHSDAEPDRAGQWVDAWRSAVRSCTAAVALVDLRSSRILDVSTSAADLIGVTPEEAIGLDAVTRSERPHEAALPLWLLATRILDAVQSRRSLRRADGSTVDVVSFSRAIRASGAGDLLLWLSGDVVTSAPPALALHVISGSGGQGDAAVDRGRAASVALDGDWRVQRLDGDLGELLGYGAGELPGMPFADLVHPDDRALLLLALARATCGPSPGERLLRLSHRNGTWRAVALTATADEEGGIPRFSFSLRWLGGFSRSGLGAGGELEELLRRIVVELHAAGVLMTADPVDARHAPALGDLSARQREVVSRLLRGERVPRIAKAMYLSQSTVRNHLAVIFRKFGVHSQEELLAQLRGTPLASPSTVSRDGA